MECLHYCIIVGVALIVAVRVIQTFKKGLQPMGLCKNS